MNDAAQKSEKTISSPTELETGGFIRIRGRIVGSGKIGKRPGLILLGVGSVLVAAIVYGVAHSGMRRSLDSASQSPVAVAAEEVDPWWKNESDAVRASSPAQNLGAPATSAALPSGVPNLSAADEAPHVSIRSAPQTESIRGSERLAHPISDFPAIPTLPDPQQFDSAPTERSVGQTDSPASAPVSKDAALQDALKSHILVGTGQSADVDAPPAANAGKSNVLGSVPTPIDQESTAAIRSNSDSPFRIAAGTVIAASLVTAIDSDLPGLLVAQVSQNAYDSATGRYLLIPQGTKVVGRYDSRIAYGQDRLFVSWQRLIFPNGASVDLHGMAGADGAGRSGFDARVDNHTRNLFRGAILLSIIGAGAQLSQPRQSSTNNSAPSVGQAIAGSVGDQIANVGTQVVQRQLNVPPNLRVPTGYQFDIMVDHDVEFAAPFAGG